MRYLIFVLLSIPLFFLPITGFAASKENPVDLGYSKIVDGARVKVTDPAEIEQIKQMIAEYKDRMAEIDALPKKEKTNKIMKEYQDKKNWIDNIEVKCLRSGEHLDTCRQRQPDGTWVEDAVQTEAARVKNLEVVDKVTSDIYCTWIENGEWIKAKGQCTSLQKASTKSAGGGGSSGPSVADVTEKMTQVVQQAQKVVNSAPQVVKDYQQAIDKKVDKAIDKAQQDLSEQIKQQVQDLSERVREEIQTQQSQQEEKKDKAPPGLIENAASSVINGVWGFFHWLVKFPF